MIEIDDATKPLLQKFGFEPDTKQPLAYSKKRDDDIIVGINFKRDKTGMLFAIRNGELLDAPEKFKELQEFKEERDKILQSQGTATKEESTSSLDVGQETVLNNQSSIHTPPDVKIVPAPNSPNLYEFFYELVGENGIIELFSDMTGYLKTATCVKTVSDALVKGKKAIYIDTEGKTGLYNKKLLMKSDCYKYIPLWEDVIKTVKSLGNYDLLIIDSVGLPVSTKASGLPLAEQGKMWSEMMSLIGNPARAWATKNKALVLFTNQAKSDMMKSEEEKRRLDAVGDKVHFVPNIILKAVDKSKVPGKYDAITKTTKLPETVVTVLSHRSPDFIDDMILFRVYKQDDKVRIEIPENVVERMKALKS